MPAIETAPGRRLVVLEPDVEGHPREWLRHLINFTAAMGAGYTVWLVVAPEVCQDLTAELATQSTARVRVLPLTDAERKFCTHRWLAVSGFARWWTMRRYLRLLGADAGHFLSIDHVSLPLALGFRAAGRRLGGILFRPSVHYPQLGCRPTRWREWLRDARKELLYQLMLLNDAVRVVLTLDPYFPGYAARRYINGTKIRAVPDPAHPPVNGTDEDLRVAERPPDDRMMFLLFGYLTQRKGVLVLLEALREIPGDIARRVAVVLAGKVDPTIRAEVQNLCGCLAIEQPDLWLHLEDRRVSTGELDALVRRADVVLAPYQRFVGSSGVLLWAARLGKPILTQDFGLLGRLVKDYQLGVAADCSDSSALAAAIRSFVQNGAAAFINAPAAHDFANSRTPQRFAQMVFDSLLHD
ncbi:MAG: glycosyltransferase family 4 protein [Alphaproteobacteria bacterium]|nr:glycosyltransferase family 4 protein [Alphaproteobacteria bacterium]